MSKVETVIYSIKITDANPGAWYKDSKGKTFDVILDNAKITFEGPEICFRLLGQTTPVKYIRLWHARIIGQRIANQSDVLKRYIHG